MVLYDNIVMINDFWEIRLQYEKERLLPLL